jgi:hypothetical protein
VIGAQVTMDDGKVVESWTPGTGVGGRLEVRAFEWTTSWGMVDAEARLQLPYDPIAALDRDVTVSARLVDRPDLVASITLAPTFGCGGVAGGVGDSGSSGWSGSSGSSGSSGPTGASGSDGDEDDDPTDGGDGGHGDHGGDGGHGSDAGDGGPGPDVEAAITRIESPRHGPLIAVVIGQGRYLIDPDGQPFAIVAEGGPGGSGGAGGSGGTGGSGGAGGDGGDGREREDGSTPNGGRGGYGGDGGDGGNGGDGARGGDGGDGGTLRVLVDARWPELASYLALSTAAGSGGYGGSAGSAGYGGSAGRGGYGGSPNGTDGTAGRDGQAGSDGRSGANGRPGRDGPPAEIIETDVGAYFDWIPAELLADPAR